MQIWYCSETRFISRIVKKWDKDKAKYNKGNINILKYAYRTTAFWAIINRNKISEKNKMVGYPKLF